MSQIYNIRGKTVKIFMDGQIFVNGTYTKLVQWKSDSKRYGNYAGSEVKELRNMDLESALRLKGWL